MTFSYIFDVQKVNKSVITFFCVKKKLIEGTLQRGFNNTAKKNDAKNEFTNYQNAISKHKNI